MKYIMAISQQRGVKRTAEVSENEDLEDSNNDSVMEELPALP